jgi:hypothetical protein
LPKWGTVFADPVVATAILDRLLHHSHVLTIRGDSYRLRAKRKSDLIKAPAADGPPVGSASLRPVSQRPSQPSTDIMNARVGQFFMTQRGQFQMIGDRIEIVLSRAIKYARDALGVEQWQIELVNAHPRYQAQALPFGAQCLYMGQRGLLVRVRDSGLFLRSPTTSNG